MLKFINKTKAWKNINHVIFLIFLLVITSGFQSAIAQSFNSDFVRVANDYVITPNITYIRAGGEDLKLDVYQLGGQTGPNPTLVYFHGGGWTASSKESVALDFLPFMENGWAVVNVEYRLASSAHAPAAVEDGRCALRWIYRNAEEYGFDLNKIVASGTSDLVLDAFEAANRERSIIDRRWIVEHIPLVHPDQMQRIKRLGVMVSAQYQPYTRARTMLREWGKERTEQALPIRDLLDQGIIVSGGSDWPSFSNNPFLIMYYYVSRNTLDLGPVGVGQKISRMEALRVMTLNNAYLTYDEDIKGSIEAGKLADFVVLSADLLNVPEEQIKDIVPIATYVGGRNVYSKLEGGF